VGLRVGASLWRPSTSKNLEIGVRRILGRNAVCDKDEMLEFSRPMTLGVPRRQRPLRQLSPYGGIVAAAVTSYLWYALCRNLQHSEKDLGVPGAVSDWKLSFRARVRAATPCERE